MSPHTSRIVQSDNYCCLGRVLYSIGRCSTRYVRHGTITHVGTVQQTPRCYKVGTVQKSGRYMILACTIPPCCWLVVRETRCMTPLITYKQCTQIALTKESIESYHGKNMLDRVGFFLTSQHWVYTVVFAIRTNKD